MTKREYWLMSRSYYGGFCEALGVEERLGSLENNHPIFEQWLNKLEDGKTIEKSIEEEAPEDAIMREYMPETAWWNLVRDYPEWELELDE